MPSTAASSIKTRVHRTDFEYGEVGEDFNPEVGFLEADRRVPAALSTGWFGTLRTAKVRRDGLPRAARRMSLHALLRT